MFNPRDSHAPDDPVRVPCSKCIGCRLERSRQWAVRCVHEASLYENNSFITLTYRDDCIPENGSLDPDAFQKFLKRLRYYAGPFRFFGCGEYGEKTKRPHYHACLFNFDFPDRVLWKQHRDVSYFRSALLEKCWPYGFSTNGS